MSPLVLLLALPCSQGSFELDPVADAALLGASTSFASLLELVIRTGELQPQAPVDRENLLIIDRWRAESTNVRNLHLSDITLGVMGAAVLADIILVELLDRGDRWYEYLVIYAESAMITLAITNLVKIAVRRPRPAAYQADPNGATDSALSFFSGHSAFAGALAATATYLAFTRDSMLEAWLIAGVGLAATSLAATARVSENKHFPTDVIAGAIAGMAIGVLVPHFHRQSSVSVTAGVQDGGATLGVSGQF